MATFSTQGTKLQIKIASTYTDVPQVTAVDPVGSASALIDVTHLQSTIREYRLALQDGQEMNCAMWFSPGDVTQEAVRTAHATRVLTDFKVILSDPGGYEFAFTALVMSFSISVAVDGAYLASFVLKPTGLLTVTP